MTKNQIYQRNQMIQEQQKSLINQINQINQKIKIHLISQMNQKILKIQASQVDQMMTNQNLDLDKSLRILMTQDQNFHLIREMIIHRILKTQILVANLGQVKKILDILIIQGTGILK